jgi:hypothetical protein
METTTFSATDPAQLRKSARSGILACGLWAAWPLSC